MAQMVLFDAAERRKFDKGHLQLDEPLFSRPAPHPLEATDAEFLIAFVLPEEDRDKTITINVEVALRLNGVDHPLAYDERPEMRQFTNGASQSTRGKVNVTETQFFVGNFTLSLAGTTPLLISAGDRVEVVMTRYGSGYAGALEVELEGSLMEGIRVGSPRVSSAEHDLILEPTINEVILGRSKRLRFDDGALRSDPIDVVWAGAPIELEGIGLHLGDGEPNLFEMVFNSEDETEFPYWFRFEVAVNGQTFTTDVLAESTMSMMDFGEVLEGGRTYWPFSLVMGWVRFTGAGVMMLGHRSHMTITAVRDPKAFTGPVDYPLELFGEIAL